MKKLYLFLLVMIVTVVACQNEKTTQKNQEIVGKLSLQENSTLKRYNVPSGIVRYDIKIAGKVMGSTIDGSGKEELYFKNWGALELKKTDSKQVTHINIFGQKKTEVSETHEINKLDNGKVYSVDMNNKVIYQRQDPAMEMIKSGNNGDVVSVGEQMLESIGGEKVGKETILGYSCDVWKIPGGKQWIYKGVPLKLEMKIMGITTTNTATEAKFDVNVPDKYFELPDYPVQEIQGMGGDFSEADREEMHKSAQKIKNMSFEQYKQMIKEEDPESFKHMTEKDLKMSYQLMQKMAEQY